MADLDDSPPKRRGLRLETSKRTGRLGSDSRESARSRTAAVRANAQSVGSDQRGRGSDGAVHRQSVERVRYIEGGLSRVRNLGKETEAVSNDTHGRVSVLEHAVGQLEHRVEVGFSELTKAIHQISQNLQARPTPIPFKEIALTIAACLTCVTLIGSFLEYQSGKSIRFVEHQSAANIRFIEYRLEQLEKRAQAALAAPR